MARRPDNGPTFSKATYEADRPYRAPDPMRRQAELEQAARDCADAKLFRTDLAAWLDKHLAKKS
jgi:hypothetical protein